MPSLLNRAPQPLAGRQLQSPVQFAQHKQQQQLQEGINEYLRADFVQTADEWFSHVINETKGSPEMSHSVRKYQFHLDSDASAKKVGYFKILLMLLYFFRLSKSLMNEWKRSWRRNGLWFVETLQYRRKFPHGNVSRHCTPLTPYWIQLRWINVQHWFHFEFCQRIRPRIWAAPSIINVTKRNRWNWHFLPSMNSSDMNQFVMDNSRKAIMRLPVAIKLSAVAQPFCQTCQMQVRFFGHGNGVVFPNPMNFVCALP